MQPDQNRPLQPGDVWHGVQPPPQHAQAPLADRVQPKPDRWVLWSETHNLRRDFVDSAGATVACAFKLDTGYWYAFVYDQAPELAYVGDAADGTALEALIEEALKHRLAQVDPPHRSTQTVHCACGETASVRVGRGFLWLDQHRRRPGVSVAVLANGALW